MALVMDLPSLASISTRGGKLTFPYSCPFFPIAQPLLLGLPLLYNVQLIMMETLAIFPNFQLFTSC